MNWTAFFHGGGKRRKSEENWDELERRLSDAEARAKKVKGAYFHRCPANVHPPYWVYAEGVACPWCLVDQLRGQLELVTMRPAPRPGGVHVPAPMDQSASLIAVPDSEPVTDPTAETQPVDVRELREAVGEGDTQVLPVVAPVVAVEPTPRVTWGVTPVLPLQVKAGPGSADPTEVLPAVSRRAKTNVATALTTNN